MMQCSYSKAVIFIVGRDNNTMKTLRFMQGNRRHYHVDGNVSLFKLHLPS